MDAKMDSIEQKVREFISGEFLAGGSTDFDRDSYLLETGVIDSIGLFRLITFLEETFHVRIPDQDLLAENFQSLNHIMKYINTRIGG